MAYPGGPHGGGHFLTEGEEKNQPKVTKALLKRVFSWIGPYWKQMALIIVCVILSSALKLLPSILTGRILDEGLIGARPRRARAPDLLSLAVTLGGNLIGVLESYLQTWIAQHITFDMRNRMFRHLQAMSRASTPPTTRATSSRA
jgi:ATP-binding cassette subfamily B protein